MSKNKFEPYVSREALESNAPNIIKEWQKEKHEGYIFAARHIEDDRNNPENCLLVCLDKNGQISMPNEAKWTRYMLMDQHVNPGYLQTYSSKLVQEFCLLIEIEHDHIKQLIEKREKEREIELEKQTEATAVFLREALSRKNKYKN